jgi:hypothetical protein
MCVAVAIVAGIAVAGTVTAAKIQSNAAGNASKTSAEAADKALAFQKEQYAQSRADFNPYQQAGLAASARMEARATQPTQGFRQPAPPAAPAQLGLPQSAPPPTPPQRAPGPDVQTMGQPQGAPPQLGQSAAPEKMVTLRAPDGSTHPFPASQVQTVIQQAQAKGQAIQVVG